MKLSTLFRNVRGVVECTHVCAVYVCNEILLMKVSMELRQEALDHINSLFDTEKCKRFGVCEWLMCNHPEVYQRLLEQHGEVERKYPLKVWRTYRLAWLDHVIAELEKEGR